VRARGTTPKRRLDVAAPPSGQRISCYPKVLTPLRNEAIVATTALCTSPAHTLTSVRVRLLVWGLTDRHIQTAERHARNESARGAWVFTQIDRLTEGPCPIDISDPKVIAADCGSGWAYAVYPTGTAS
jgi:hypothetical protein